MLGQIRQKLIEAYLSKEEKSRVERALKKLASTGFDPWGVSPSTLMASLASTVWFYRRYFRVATHGIQNVPPGRCLLIANHSGQVPIDAMMIATAVLLELEPPRLVRGMVERWAPSLPFIGTFFSRCGQITGDMHNAKSLLENDECLMVFPEGVGGSGKTIFDRYELQKFGTGFVRLAMETKTPIVPVAVIGCEEMLPSLSKLSPLAKLIGAPYIPVVPTVLPLPTKISIRFGEPIVFDANPDEPDVEVYRKVETVRTAIRTELDTGLKLRGERIFTGSGA
ncbi:MAG: acyltransferase family protein [Bdellovibrionales bacterium]|nr:acyltransferase family protein [Bdellovibrionales bacterium]